MFVFLVVVVVLLNWDRLKLNFLITLLRFEHRSIRVFGNAHQVRNVKDVLKLQHLRIQYLMGLFDQGGSLRFDATGGPRILRLIQVVVHVHIEKSNGFKEVRTLTRFLFKLIITIVIFIL